MPPSVPLRCHPQELLWVLVSLADDDLVYKDDMRDAGLPALLVSLFSVYQANQGAAELRPIAAQILRCLQLMAAGDEAMQVGSLPGQVGEVHSEAHVGLSGTTGAQGHQVRSLAATLRGACPASCS
jgi:hypothetical protein